MLWLNTVAPGVSGDRALNAGVPRAILGFRTLAPSLEQTPQNGSTLLQATHGARGCDSHHRLGAGPSRTGPVPGRPKVMVTVHDVFHLYPREVNSHPERRRARADVPFRSAMRRRGWPEGRPRCVRVEASRPVGVRLRARRMCVEAFLRPMPSPSRSVLRRNAMHRPKSGRRTPNSTSCTWGRDPGS